jgi:hypothetical protein
VPGAPWPVCAHGGAHDRGACRYASLQPAGTRAAGSLLKPVPGLAATFGRQSHRHKQTKNENSNRSLPALLPSRLEAQLGERQPVAGQQLQRTRRAVSSICGDWCKETGSERVARRQPDTTSSPEGCLAVTVLMVAQPPSQQAAKGCCALLIRQFKKNVPMCCINSSYAAR